ncbi:Mannosyl oligosaccharide glucosidase [Novipirellula aureliae]|uniref:Mannosyl oligosaccharide glucosidase n=1 Tax=Novipirellula aureliae TaxID=2527966 RepID=A0A5C6E5U4_9BACT|nr:glucosidase [Novipirellula aureliae]TWU43327.1 Mannosyl oligosaccharide glucosidase [Novipirellula aureliae]
MPTPEHARLRQDEAREKNWKRWGPYLSERQWGTVREDYSANGHSWTDFPHDHARSRVYRWGEDGLLGFTDRQCRLCFSVALWNGNDTILKERLFGLTGPEGNHGEDVKEIYYYLDSTPTHSFAKAMYRYPHARYPYRELSKVNSERGLNDPEYEVVDTGLFDKNCFFDVTATYAKADENDLLIEIAVTNHGRDAHEITLLPTLWFRNTWVWGCRHEGCTTKPLIQQLGSGREHVVRTKHDTLPPMVCQFESIDDSELIFTENETNAERLFKDENFSPYTKDAFHRYVVSNETDAVNPKHHGTKVASVYRWDLEPDETRRVRVRLADPNHSDDSDRLDLGDGFSSVMQLRRKEADSFYDAIIPANETTEQRHVSRAAYAGLMWTKQFYHYIVDDWLEGDADVMTPPPARKSGRNRDWRHFYARDILSMPDKWEYPWFAAWDLAFHMIPAARIDPAFAKRQLMLLLREWYMHPNGQLPAYEFYFDDVNPPVHAWACFRVFQMEAEAGRRDTMFLKQTFQRLLLNFTWWVNRVDSNGDNVFAGGFLGLDNIGVFDRSKGLPEGAHLEQADGTAWMAFYCGTMMSMALELARDDKSYSDMASKFLDHFIRIIDAMNHSESGGLWDEQDGFYYDQLKIDDETVPMRVRSLVGLLPLIAIEILDEELLDELPGFRQRLDWFLQNRRDLAKHIEFAETSGHHRRMLISIAPRHRLRRVLSVLLDENEFLSKYGIRSLSKVHLQQPFQVTVRGDQHTVAYVPGESDSWMFGGNSNWRGPIWFPPNYLLIEALHRYHEFYGDEFQIECPTGSGKIMNLHNVANEINRRLSNIFLCPEGGGARPCLIGSGMTGNEHLWQDHVLFYEYFHGDTGEGLGASHQTGWTALIATCIEQLYGQITEGAPHDS